MPLNIRKLLIRFKLQIVCLWLMLSGLCPVCAAQVSPAAESLKALYQGDHQRAAELAAGYLETHPNDARMRVILARAKLAQGEFQAACDELRLALRADPQNIDALYYLGMVAGVLAQQEYERLYAIAPDSARVHQLLGEAALAQENQTEAENEFLSALRVNPHSVDVLTAMGELRRSQSKFDEALEYYSRAEAAGPLSYDIAYGLGACYSYKQDHERAVAYFRQAVSLDAGSGAGHFALGNALFQSGQTAAAITELKAALALEPKLKQAYFLLGRAYQKLGAQDAAQEAFRKLDELTREEIEKEKGAANSQEIAKPSATPDKPPKAAGTSGRKPVTKPKP
ncbi:MAG TPA: tetratricopeptide repeat protein [Blastocatellia bacterium]|nr:tetratricopeptide repeat protein [Blastocatellia bacterium]